jgi:intracellular sulfur oxidation DsrE/DsrF family protein
MTMNRRSLLTLLGLGAAAAPALAQQKKPAAKHRVIFQVSDNDPARWQLALSNARNVQTDLGKENVQIEIVAYGPGIEMMKAESKVAGGLAAALDTSVGLIVCENTMQNNKVSRDEMYAGIGFVQAGVTHLMKRQKEGWAYIRP